MPAADVDNQCKYAAFHPAKLRCKSFGQCSDPTSSRAASVTLARHRKEVAIIPALDPFDPPGLKPAYSKVGCIAVAGSRNQVLKSEAATFA